MTEHLRRDDADPQKTSDDANPQGAFIPDANRANDLHVKSMERHDRQSCDNQELALAVTSLRAEAENPKQQWRTNLSWLYVDTRSCIYIFVLLQKQEYI